MADYNDPLIRDHLLNSLRPAGKCTKLYFVWDFIPLSMLIMGILNVDKCPHQPMIPKWLIVMGAVWLVHSSIAIYDFIKNRNAEERIPLPTILALLVGALQLFVFVWQILGSIWIYGASVNYDHSSSDYCDKGLYIFSIVAVTLPYVLVGVLLLTLCCLCVCGLVFINTAVQQEQEEV